MKIITQTWLLFFNFAWIYFDAFFVANPLQYNCTAAGFDASNSSKINLMNNPGKTYRL